MSVLPKTVEDRAQYPMADGLLYYFPAALAEVARCSKIGNDQHNPGQPMHWAMDKSTDHANKIIRHLLECGTDDTDGIAHSVKVAWRALALAQEDLMNRSGATIPRNAIKNRFTEADIGAATLYEIREPFPKLEQDEDGVWHFTDGGQSSETLIFPETPELSAEQAALAEFQSDEPPFRNPDSPVGEGEAA